MKLALSVLLTALLVGCSVEFKSSQLSAIRNVINNERKSYASDLWYVLFEDVNHEAYAFVNKDKYRLYSLEYLEVDVQHALVTKIMVPTPVRYEIVVTSTATGMVIHNGANSQVYTLSCAQMRQESTFVYTQFCYTEDGLWHFRNQVQVDENREIVYLKNFYDPSKSPIELYYSPLLKSLRASVENGTINE